jgi:predicted heme/steroid binding protein
MATPSVRWLTWPRLAIVCGLLLSHCGAMALQLTEPELSHYSGTSSSKEIYLSLNHTIFNVSALPSFYGPGGHYRHFTGKDASRAWVTECWDSSDQLTWRMEGAEELFMPRYLDEELETTASGTSAIEGAEAYGREELAMMARTILGKLGKVTEREKKDRRERDRVQALREVDEKIGKWLEFFHGNEKYDIVGTLVLDKDKPEAPVLCGSALRKRPLKGGKLDNFLKMAGGGAQGIFGAEKQPSPGEMPAFVREGLKKRREEQAVGVRPGSEDDGDELVKHEL